jgi:hypothetical protein
MKKLKFLLLVFALAVLGCQSQQSANLVPGSESPTVRHSNETQHILRQDIKIFIGRGGCCYGHFVSVTREGRLSYSVATYELESFDESHSPSSQLETFDPELIKVDRRYAVRERDIATDTRKQIAELLLNIEGLRFQDDLLVDDDMVYHIYLDDQLIAYGYHSNLNRFPTRLQDLISLILGQVELHQLPGMA